MKRGSKPLRCQMVLQWQNVCCAIRRRTTIFPLDFSNISSSHVIIVICIQVFSVETGLLYLRREIEKPSASMF
jgi:hypothetical protein